MQQLASCVSAVIPSLIQHFLCDCPVSEFAPRQFYPFQLCCKPVIKRAGTCSAWAARHCIVNFSVIFVLATRFLSSKFSLQELEAAFLFGPSLPTSLCYSFPLQQNRMHLQELQEQQVLALRCFNLLHQIAVKATFNTVKKPGQLRRKEEGVVTIRLFTAGGKGNTRGY